MPHPTPTSQDADPDSALPPRPSRLRWLAAPFRPVWRWFAHQPRAIQIGLCLILVAGAAAGSVYVWSHLKKRERTAAVAAAWREYETARGKFDAEAMRAALDQVLAANPNDATALRRKEVLDRGEADADTPELALLFLYQYIQANKPVEAAREAEKVLAHNPKHWTARCALAHHALQVRKDRALAEQVLAQLPDPDDPRSDLHPSGLLYSLQLFEALGLDSDKLRRVIVLRFLPLLRSNAVASAAPGTKVLLLNCYLAPFGDPDALGELGAFWAIADRLADSAVSDAIVAGDVPVLVQLGALGPRLRGALALLRAHAPDQLPDERFAPMAKAIDERTRRTWTAVRDRAPDRPEAYRGLALLAVQENDAAAALRQLLDGLAACGDRAELFDLLIPLISQRGTPESVQKVAQQVWAAAEAAKTDPVKWCLAATAARAADDVKGALDACRRVREIDPKHPWACATEAQLWLRAGKFVEARDALAPLGEAALRTNPLLARLNARAMVGCGLTVLLDGELKAVAEAQAAIKPKTTAPVLAFLLGVFDAEPTVERTEWVIANVTRLLVDDPAAPGGRRLQAEALYRLAELTVTPHPKADGSPPVWNAEKVAVALRAFEQLPLNERAEAAVIAMVAALQLRGQDMKAAALRTITPLMPLEASLPAAQLEVLGAVLTANDRAADAVRVLERATKLPYPTAGCRVALALAYRKNNQPIDAKAELAKAFQVTSCSEREHAERVAAKILLQRENP